MSRTHAVPVEARPAPNPDFTGGLPDFQGPDVLTLGQAAQLCGLKPPTIRDAVKSGDLPGFIPRGRKPGHTGPGNGYRVFRADLQRWFFGTFGVEEEVKDE
jgi:hypothetical protein